MNYDYLVKRTTLLKALEQICDEEGSSISKEFFDLVISNRLKDYLSLSMDDVTYFSYTKKPEDVLDDKRRNKCAIRRYITRHLGHFHDAAIDNYGNSIFNKLNIYNVSIKIVSGTDIVDAYCNQYGYSSCMTDSTTYHFTKFYADNDVRMLLYNDGYHKARALIFNTIEGPTVLDRIYPNSGPHIRPIIDIAKKKGWLVREHNSAPTNTILFNNEIYSIRMKKAEQYPYMDSFCFTSNLDEDIIILSSKAKDDTKYALWSTEGKYLGRCHCGKFTKYILDGVYVCENHLKNHSHCNRCNFFFTNIEDHKCQ